MGKVVMLVFPSRGVMLDAVDHLNSLDYLKNQTFHDHRAGRRWRNGDP